MSHQLWRHHFHFVPYFCFFLFDVFIHCGLTYLGYHLWFEYVSIKAALAAWVFNRCWSFVHANGRTMFFKNAERVYSFEKPMPAYAYNVLYIFEFTILAASVCLK